MLTGMLKLSLFLEIYLHNFDGQTALNLYKGKHFRRAYENL